MWPEVQLDQLGIVSRGRSRHRPRNDPALYGGAYPFIQTAEVKSADLRITSHTQTYNETGLAQSCLWPKDTLCITIAANIADTALLSYPACFPDSIIGFIADESKCDVRFIKYFFNTVQERMKMVSQGATQDNLSQDKLLRFGIPCPPLETQRKIGDFLSAYDDLIETNVCRIALLEESAQLLYREWFIKLRFPGHELVKVVNGVPEGWCRNKLDAALFLQRGFDLPSANRKDGNVPIYASTGINGYHSEAKASGPGVVTGRSGTLGVIHFIFGDYWPLNTSLWVKEFRLVTPIVGYFMLLELNLAQYNSGASVPTLDRKVVHQIEVLIPDKKIMDEFDVHVIPIFEQIKNLKDWNTKLAEARDALLPKLMSGQLAV